MLDPDVNESSQPKVFGLHLAPLTFQGAVQAVHELVSRRTPSFFITANLNYCMLSDQDPTLQRVNREASFILADGMPLVWATRFTRNPLPERVAGSDLLPALCGLAADENYRVFFLGGSPEAARDAAANLTRLHPALNIVGVETPRLSELSAHDERALVEQIRRARPDILFVALGQPRGEKWIFNHLRQLDVPVAVQIGASLDFAAQRIKRAPVLLRRLGLEWTYRLYREPLRLGPRYFRNGLFLIRSLVRSLPALFRSGP